METIHKDYCSICKRKQADVKYFKSKPNKKGVCTQYYHCRECNRKRFNKYYHNNKTKVREIIYRSIAKHFNKQSARIELNKAVKRGDIEKPTACDVCKSTPDRLEGHHTDYNKPLEVSWVCTNCHAALDKEMRKKVV